MTGPQVSPTDIQFVDASVPVGASMDLSQVPEPVVEESGVKAGKLPPSIIDVSEERKDAFRIWLDEWLMSLISDQANKQKEWNEQEEGYRALPQAPQAKPFVGCDDNTVPAIAMAVDPIHARLSTGIFKQDPVFNIKGLKKSVLKYVPAISAWLDYYQKHRLHLREVMSPRLLECAKLGTCVLKTTYERETATIKTYDNKAGWKVIDKTELRFSGPKVKGVSLGDFLFPPRYQHLQQCPIVAERIRTTYQTLLVQQAQGKLANVKDLEGQAGTASDTELEAERARMSGHQSSRRYYDDIEIYEVWCDYDINNDGVPEHLVCTYHKDTRTILQLRYNWYFHQRKPYTVIPYTVTNDSMYGIGVAEMVLPFQRTLTKWEQMAKDNAYLANIRMYIAKKQSGIEEVPRLYAGRVFEVEDPTKDFIPFSGGDIYPSTLTERQNTFGLVEKRTGVSDYLTGRESPIIGSRGTATATLALIQEGTKRVEEVMENIRVGLAEVQENCMYIWIQYGLDGLDDVVFGDDEIGALIKEFFAGLTAENVNGAIAIDLTATDASGNRQAMQQMQLQILTILMQYLEKLLAAGQGALQALASGQPEMAEMIRDTMTAARNMVRDLLTKYDIRNPEDYIPDLERYINAGLQQSAAGPVTGSQGPVAGPAAAAGMDAGAGAPVGPVPPSPAQPGSGGSALRLLAAAGQG